MFLQFLPCCKNSTSFITNQENVTAIIGYSIDPPVFAAPNSLIGEEHRSQNFGVFRTSARVRKSNYPLVTSRKGSNLVGDRLLTRPRNEVGYIPKFCFLFSVFQFLGTRPNFFNQRSGPPSSKYPSVGSIAAPGSAHG
jgi:hypothetical protein